MSAPSPLHNAVTVVQFVAASAALAFVVLLFVNEPENATTSAPDGGGGASSSGQIDGATVFADNCAGCHGADGGGGTGPQLSEGQIGTRFPNVEDQIAVVTNGQGPMPAFGGRLSPEAIQAVVEYTRTL